MEQRKSTDLTEVTTKTGDASPETPRELDLSDAATPRVLDSEEAETPRPQHASLPPPAKRFKPGDSSGVERRQHQQHQQQAAEHGSNPETALLSKTPVMANPQVQLYTDGQKRENLIDAEPQTPLPDAEPRTPVPLVHRRHSTGGSSSPSDLSSSSRTNRDASLSPATPYAPEIPPAPPCTPASDKTAFSGRFEGLSTPLPYSAVRNADQLEQQQLLSEGAVTPAPTKPDRPPRPNQQPLSDDFSEWAVGDRYKLLRMLGRGSYGEVAQALDLHQGRSDAYVAIKRIQSPFDQEVDAVRLFREIHILRRLRGHECVIQLMDVVEPPSDDLDDFHDLYLVFEYVDTDLYKLIMSPQYLTTEHIQTFLYQMLAGLKFLHSASVIHRDLKPANILLNEDCSLKICDFGLARIVESSSMMSTSKDEEDKAGKTVRPASSGRFSSIPKAPLTRQLTKHVVTRWYRAPELILIQPYTSAVDIWSLGCILAELLSMQQGAVPSYQDRSPLFPGGTCYPLSGETSVDERLDQLSVIFGVIGTPSPEDIGAIGKANEYIKTLGEIKPKELKKLFPEADPAALDLLKEMLKFNPKQRCTAEEALGHGFLKGVRKEEMEQTADEPLVSPEFLGAVEIDLQTLKLRTYEEVLWYRKQEEKEKNTSGDKVASPSPDAS